MRFVDALFRQGHLSDRVITEAILTGDRPVHLDQCDICAERALDLNRWLEAVRSTAFDAADAVFTPEKLAAQQTQILRRLEQLDEPARVIAFPAQTRHAPLESDRRRIAPAWLGVAAAAGLVIGALGGQAAARLDRAPAAAATETPAPAQATPALELQTFDYATASLLDVDVDVLPDSLSAINDITPRIQTVALRH